MTKRTSITVAQKGFDGRRTKWRVAWSAGQWDPTTDARSAVFRAEKAAGRAGVDYVRGARPEVA